VHEVDFGLVEKEVVVQRCHLKTIVECGGQRIVDFVFKQNGISHHHRFVIAALECRPSSESHEGRHLPSVYRNLDIGAR